MNFCFNPSSLFIHAVYFRKLFNQVLFLGSIFIKKSIFLFYFYSVLNYNLHFCLFSSIFFLFATVLGIFFLKLIIRVRTVH